MKEFLQSLTNALADKPTHFILLIASFVFVSLSIIYDRYIVETFLTLTYAVGVTYLTLARKHESIGKYIVGTECRLRLYISLFIVWFLVWAYFLFKSLLNRF